MPLSRAHWEEDGITTVMLPQKEEGTHVEAWPGEEHQNPSVVKSSPRASGSNWARRAATGGVAWSRASETKEGGKEQSKEGC